MDKKIIITINLDCEPKKIWDQINEAAEALAKFDKKKSLWQRIKSWFNK